MGITSTHVENTLIGKWWNGQTRDHLHTRGEYFPKKPSSSACIGSPPHTWRIQRLRFNYYFRCRITSTHVENTMESPKQGTPWWDHLHTRGEYLVDDAKQIEMMGSPPHTWRILSRPFKNLSKLRITSTHVENTTRNSFL